MAEVKKEEALGMFFKSVGIVTGVPAGLFIIIGLPIVAKAFVFGKLWSWFIVPTFGGHELGLATCCGLCAIVHCLTLHGSSNWDKPKKGELSALFFTTLLRCATTLLIGWIITKF